MSDKLVFDLSQEVDGSPNVFVKKDWLNILDNQSGNYNGNQSVIDTSQLTNSNKWLSYREGYFYIPMLLSLQAPAGVTGQSFAVAGTSADYAVGLKSWFGQMIHSFTLDYNGTTIIQQTPFCNVFNSFKLLTSFSQDDVVTLGATIGFYPDDPLTWTHSAVASPSGYGTANNTNLLVASPVVADAFNNFKSAGGNEGFLKRQQFINFTDDATYGTALVSTLFTDAGASALWKSHISQKTATNLQYSISAVVHLKHLHSFFQSIPLLKGVYMKMTLNLNNSNCAISVTGTNAATSIPTGMALTASSVPSGGVQPAMIASVLANNGASNLFATGGSGNAVVYLINLSVGSTCLNSTMVTNGAGSGAVGKNIYLYLPAYSFNPLFESAYLSSPIKSIKYTDIYQYQVSNIGGGNGSFNQLITNGIANIKSVLIVPLYASSSNPVGLAGIPAYQSPFDTAGCGTTSPLCHFSNFNVVISGQNSIYNSQRYAFEEWNNQLYGANAVNGGQMDGLSSGLISQLGWEMNYCYYYVNVSRMLPVEESVPKSVQIIGQNNSVQPVDLMVFIEYGCSVDVDILSGSRVG